MREIFGRWTDGSAECVMLVALADGERQKGSECEGAMESLRSVVLQRPAGQEREPLPEPAPPTPRRPRDWLFQYVPALDSLRTYSWQALRCDLVAGFTVAAVAVPQAMAYATIAGLEPKYGLYTAIVMTLVGALLDSSKQLINGPTNAISIAVLSALAAVPSTENPIAWTIVLTFLIGLVQTGITLMRLGDLTRFISHSVIVGFTLGASLLLVMDQFKNFLGLKLRQDPESHFLLRFFETLKHSPESNPWTVGVGLCTVAIVLRIRAVNRARHWVLPEFLIAMMAMAFLVGWFRLDQRGVAVVGDIPAELPSFALPDLTWPRVRGLMGSALAVAILGLLEAIAMAKAIAARTSQKLDINQQCLSEGLANLAGSLFQCMPGSGSLTRSSINVQAGAVSQWSGVIAALAVAGTVLLFAPFAYYIPRSALAGILALSAWRLVDRGQLLYHLRTTRFDAGIVLATALSAIVVSVEFCILIGVFLSFVLFVPRAAKLHLNELVLTSDRVLQERDPQTYTKNGPCNRILIFSLEGELFFGAASDLERHLDLIAHRAQNGVRVVVLRLKRVRNPDAVCLELFDRFLTRMKEARIPWLLCGVRPDLEKALHASHLYDRLGEQRVFLERATEMSSTLEAVRHAYELLDGDVCEQCPRRQEAAKEPLYYMI